jgi:hypothetical protein
MALPWKNDKSALAEIKKGILGNGAKFFWGNSLDKRNENLNA